MKKVVAGSFALALLLWCTAALAQYDTGAADKSAGKQAAADKTKDLKGTISQDGKSFTTDKDKKSWTIVNPEDVKGHEGHHVILNAHVYPDKNSIHVMSVKMVPDKNAAKGGDMKQQ